MRSPQVAVASKLTVVHPVVERSTLMNGGIIRRRKIHAQLAVSMLLLAVVGPVIFRIMDMAAKVVWEMDVPVTGMPMGLACLS